MLGSRAMHTVGSSRQRAFSVSLLMLLGSQVTVAMHLGLSASRRSISSRSLDRLPWIGRGGGSMLNLGVAIPSGGSDEDQDNSPPSPPSNDIQLDHEPDRDAPLPEPLEGQVSLSSPSETEAPLHPHIQLDSNLPQPTTVDSSSEATIASLIGPLFAMTRPTNFPAVVLFHMIGVHLVLSKLEQSSAYWSTLFTRPTIGLTLVALLLTSSTSMLVNDYYDTRLGRDINKQTPLVQGTIPMAVARRFTSWLYAICLLIVTVLPGTLCRMSVVTGLMLTYLYTVHFKPIPWLKNIVCACLIALSPLTSGAATFAVSGANQWQIFAVGSLWRLGASLFFGIMGREMMMDCNDVENDSAAGVRTVPVVYGNEYASKVSLGFTSLMATLCLAGPVIQVAGGLMGGSTSLAAIRRLVFGTASSVGMLRQSWKVYITKARDSQVVSRAVDQGLINVVLALASFV